MKNVMITRKVGILSAAGLLTLAGIGAAIGHTNVHAAAPAAHIAQVQSGDQTAPDTGTAAENAAESPEVAGAADPAGGADVQTGDQTTPDTAAAAESPEAASATDAPGGADVQSGPQN